MSANARPKKSLGAWLRRHSLTLVAAVGGAAGVAYAAASHEQAAAKPIHVQPPPAIAIAIAPPPVQAPTPTEDPVKVAEPPRDNVQDVVQIALLLDTSSSMDGLINQARSHLWNMVDKMGGMTRVVDGKTRGVRIELALYEYGNDTLSARTGFIRQVLPFTSDLDKVSEKLHGLFTNGGSEHVGQAIDKAVTQLQWSSDENTMKFVFVAGNEEFDQGPITAAKAMKAAAGKNVNVQLIHCGGTDTTWEAAAKLAKSDLLTIDQNHVAAHIASPQDADILALGNELNATYMAYGADGAAAYARQSAADSSSAQLSPKVALERAQLKSKGSYRNDAWDMVDAVANNARFWEEAKDADLPEAMRGKSLEEKKQMVAANAAKRTEIQQKIAKLETERTKFIEAERAKLGTDEAKSLETELLKSTKKIANEKGYKL
jgi:hypothetical protein